LETLIVLPQTLVHSCTKKGIEMRIEHSLPPGFLGRRRIRVLVMGAGGTGSAILMGLPYLDQAMRVWGHPYGLQVSIMDADTVSETNCFRQPFSASDIGQNKATVLSGSAARGCHRLRHI
jgi:molybdopterin/thiamine biosynthesis adenylyltransferase